MCDVNNTLLFCFMETNSKISFYICNMMLKYTSEIHFLFVVHSTHIYLPMKMEQTECSETTAYKLQTPGNYPK